LARIDKTNSAIGVFRGALAADLPAASFDTVIGAGLDANGKVVPGVGVTGIVGLLVPIKGTLKATNIVDVLTTGEIVEVDQVVFDPADKVYVETSKGALSTGASLTSLGTVAFADTGDLVTVSAAHGLAVNDPVIVGTVTTTTGITAGVVYYVKTVDSTTVVTLSATVGGATLALTTNGTSTAIYKGTAVANVLVGFTVEADRVVVRHGIS